MADAARHKNMRLGVGQQEAPTPPSSGDPMDLAMPVQAFRDGATQSGGQRLPNMLLIGLLSSA